MGEAAVSRYRFPVSRHAGTGVFGLSSPTILAVQKNTDSTMSGENGGGDRLMKDATSKHTAFVVFRKTHRID